MYAMSIVKDETTTSEPLWVAYHPALPGCMSQGWTITEAIENLADARQEYIASLVEDGVVVPSELPIGLLKVTIDFGA
jgi:predicted RNase H-like HicB family nuclease